MVSTTKRAASLALIYLGFSGFEARAAAAADACSLITRDEFAKVIGRAATMAPESTFGGTVCGYEDGQVILYSGKNSQAQFDGLMKSFDEKPAKIPVSGVGDRAYAFYTKPRTEYQDPSAFVVFNKGEYTVAVTVYAERGKSGETVHDKALTLAKMAAARLK